MFTRDSLIWGMDSPGAQAHIIRFDRASGRIEIGQPLPGPVWYTKQLADGFAVLQTSVEWYGKFSGSTTRHANVFVSSDLVNWTSVGKFEKDRLHPFLFRHGVIHFSFGPQSVHDFTMHGDALIGFDGESVKACISGASLGSSTS